MSLIPEISVLELKRKLDQNEPMTILDVRESEEYALCRIPGSKLIPLGELPGRLDELDPSAYLAVHCRSGRRSAKAVQLLREKGFSRAVNVAGGILAWAEDVDPSMQVE